MDPFQATFFIFDFQFALFLVAVHSGESMLKVSFLKGLGNETELKRLDK